MVYEIVRSPIQVNGSRTAARRPYDYESPCHDSRLPGRFWPSHFYFEQNKLLGSKKYYKKGECAQLHETDILLIITELGSWESTLVASNHSCSVRGAVTINNIVRWVSHRNGRLSSALLVIWQHKSRSVVVKFLSVFSHVIPANGSVRPHGWWGRGGGRELYGCVSFDMYRKYFDSLRWIRSLCTFSWETYRKQINQRTRNRRRKQKGRSSAQNCFISRRLHLFCCTVPLSHPEGEKISGCK